MYTLMHARNLSGISVSMNNDTIFLFMKMHMMIVYCLVWYASDSIMTQTAINSKVYA